VVGLHASGVDVGLLLDDVGGFILYYGQEHGWTLIIDALSDNPGGLGTGMNTGPARYAFSAADAFNMNLLSGVESYYVKSIVELSFIGFPVVVALLWMPVVRCIRMAGAGSSAAIRGYAAGFAGFFLSVAALSVRFWPLDVDPDNVYFWVFAGILFKLHRIGRDDVSDVYSMQDAGSAVNWGSLRPPVPAAHEVDR
jgi:hypothetical protein